MSHTVRWTVEKTAQRLALIEPLVYRRRAELPNFRYVSPPGANPDLGVEILPNTYWGRPFSEFTLRTTFQVPSDWDASQPIALYLPLGDAGNFSHPEALVIVDGMTYAACDRHHQEVLLRPEWADGRPHELVLQGWTGLGDDWNTSTVTRTVMRPCAVVQIDQPTRELVATTRVALGTARILDPNDPARVGLLNALDAAFKALDIREPFGEQFYESAIIALVTLNSAIADAGAPLDVAMTATGHAHIDVAWLWTLDQTRRKAARTFHTVLRLMEQFPEYHFTQSQPQLYEYVREDHPQLFEAVRARVAEGRWEAMGGMWVEADCNLSGAEALARQFLLGRAYFRQHFGADAESPVLWLPDVFGYAWALPQLIKQAGLDYFFTIKLGWNQYNRIPYDSFWWQGLDGTRVLTHFSTAPENSNAPIGTSTYNAPADPESALYAWKNFQQKEVQREVFMAFGYGDGGGGPTREMLENLRAMARFPGLPQARQRPAGDFFRDLEAASGADLPVWNGELYLEYHRGAYTTQGRTKRANRKAEFALHDAEFLASFAACLDPGYVYPAETFTQAWRLVCLNQFHDIIPGSSIGQVYVDSLKQYTEVQQMTDTVRDQALACLAARAGGDWLLANPTSFSRSDPVFLPGEFSRGLERDGQALAIQPVEGGILVDAGELPPYGVVPLHAAEAGPAAPATGPEVGDEDNRTSSGVLGARGADASSLGPVSDRVPPSSSTEVPAIRRGACLENDLLRVEFSEDGDIVRIFDKANQREVLPPGAVANQFQAFEDRPKFWDAWDIDIFYDDKLWLAEPAASIELVEQGPLRWTLEIRRQILNSVYTQRISLTRGSARLDFDTKIDWRERHILLKVAFPVDVLAPQATYDIQWGNVQRPTHRNTSWDWARFETCAHKWVDLSEGGYGVSLLNDCKYGHDIRDNIMRLSLLRSPTVPDPEADQGEHHFTYSLLPHAGGWEAGTAAEAYRLNDPVIGYRCAVSSEQRAVESGQWAVDREQLSMSRGKLPAAHCSLLTASAPHIVVETVKRAEDGDGLVVRFYESQRRRGHVTLTCAFPLARVEKVNLLEETQATLSPEGNQVTLFVKPYEIVSLRLSA
jgi:alpha-mannosidase